MNSQQRALSTPLKLRFLPCSNTAVAHLVFIHGWGADSACWQSLTQELNTDYDISLLDIPGFGENSAVYWQGLNDLLHLMEQGLPERCVLVGWSLGGMLATRIAAQSKKVSHLVTIASNACFVASPQWPKAMSEEDFQGFKESFRAAPEACLQGFIGLQALGDTNRRQVQKSLRARLGFTENMHDPWLRALALLENIDNQKVISELTCKALHILGAKDKLVPAEAKEPLAALNRLHRVELMPDCAHVPHISAPVALAALIRAHVESSQPSQQPSEALSKSSLASNFSGAAKSYDACARLQKHVLDKALGYLDNLQLPEGSIADLGCGTGRALPALGERFDNRQLYALDLAEGMAVTAKQKIVTERALVMQGDIETLPFADCSLALAFSSLCVQWCEPVRFLKEIYRCLRPGGIALFSTLGPKTLEELKSVWAAFDRYQHVNDFCSVEHLAAQVNKQGFAQEFAEESVEPLLYPSVYQLMKELKGIGARNINASRPKGLLGPQKMRVIEAAYRKGFSQGDNIFASYHVLYFCLRKPL